MFEQFFVILNYYNFFMKLKIKLIIYLYFFSSLMIFFAKKPISVQYQYQNTPTVEYKIQKGDTLWGISHKFTNKNHQEFIYLIKKMNNLDSSLLMEDQILILPVNI
jgi:hypothetical protein